MDVIVGGGGWDYYPTDEEDRLKAFARQFSFVEVNSTFYHMPRLSTARANTSDTDFVQILFSAIILLHK